MIHVCQHVLATVWGWFSVPESTATCLGFFTFTAVLATCLISHTEWKLGRLALFLSPFYSSSSFFCEKCLLFDLIDFEKHAFYHIICLALGNQRTFVWLPSFSPIYIFTAFIFFFFCWKFFAVFSVTAASVPFLSVHKIVFVYLSTDFFQLKWLGLLLWPQLWQNGSVGWTVAVAGNMLVLLKLTRYSLISWTRGAHKQTPTHTLALPTGLRVSITAASASASAVGGLGARFTSGATTVGEQRLQQQQRKATVFATKTEVSFTRSPLAESYACKGHHGLGTDKDEREL